MTLTTIYKRPLEMKYMTPACSVAMFFHVLSIAAIIVVPAVVGFYTRNLWVSEMSYFEQPDVQFKYKMIVFLQNSQGDSKMWSTWSYFNTLSQDILSVPSVSVDEQDTDRDGLTDLINITLQFTESDITACQTLLVFQYKLSKLCSLVMETPLYIQSTVRRSERLLVLGDVSLRQRQTLQPHNPNTVYNTSLIADASILQSYDVAEILRGVSRRSLSTKLDGLYSVTTPSQQFAASYVIHVPQQRVRYEPGFWEAMKYAWIQYITLLVIVRYMVCRVRAFVFHNMILTTLRHDNVKTGQ